MGDFDAGNFGKIQRGTVWILFLLCTLLNLVVMLNLLIAIISDTFSAVQLNSINAMYQQMASIIAENQYLIPIDALENFCKENTGLVIAEEVIQVIGVQQVETLVTNLTEKIDKMMDDGVVGGKAIEGDSSKSVQLNETIESLDKKLDGNSGSVKKVEERVTAMNSKVDNLTKQIESSDKVVREMNNLMSGLNDTVNPLSAKLEKSE